MRLLSLELHGFKSFPERTKITFDAGMTVIVGPNGSGKSNISDAVNWVLGELNAKNIRGVKLEDVIFGGTDKRSPMGFAEVSLTIDNTGEFRIPSDYTEITVTRRYFRTGESEYLLNGKPSRRQTIVDLFMNTGIGKTGYSIIGQGRISEIISQRSEDRRYIFEEAAGITRYRVNKEKAERKLAETEANLVRLNDMFAVLEQRVGPLEREASKARTYLDLYEKKKAIDVALAVFDISNIAAQTEAFERNYHMARHSLEMAEDSLTALKNQQTALFARQEENKQKHRESIALLAERREERGTAVTDKRLAQQQMEHGQEELDRYASEIRRKEEARAAAVKNWEGLKLVHEEKIRRQEALKKEFETFGRDLEEITTAADDLSKEQKERLQERTDCEKRLVEDRIRLSSLETAHASLSERSESVKGEIDEATAALQEIEQKLAKSDANLSSYRASATETQGRKEALTTTLESLEAEIVRITDELNAAKVSRTAKLEQAATLQRMEDHFDGYQKSVKFVLDASAAGRLQGICGPVSKLIRVDGRYSLAIETALGGNIQNIVTENEAAARDAISLLKRENAGRATFYPLNSVHGEPLRVDLARAKKFSGYIGVASELVDTDSRYREVISLTLGRTFVFDTLDHASEMARAFHYTVRIVTLDGQLINAGGSYTGGSAKRDSGILSRARDIDALTAAAADLETRIESLTQKIADTDRQLSGTRTALDELNDSYMLLAAMYRAEESTHGMLEGQLRTQKDAVDTLLRAKEHIHSQESAGSELRHTLLNEIDELTAAIERINSRLGAIAGESEANAAVIARRTEAKNAKLLEITVAGKEVEAACLAMDQGQADVDRIDREKEELAVQAKEKEAGFAHISENIQAIGMRCEELDRQIAEIQELIRTLEAEADEFTRLTVELTEKMESKNKERDTYYKQYTNLEGKRNGLLGEKDKITERLWEDYELTFSAALELDYPPITAETRNKSVSEQGRLRSRIRELGPVNVSAIDEYAEVKEQYENQGRQIADLNKSREEYGGIVTKLEKEMRQKFTESFRQINENFAVTFRDLFGGGSARLELTEPDDVLTSGIEIIVAPPGKVIKNLKSLSGGEQVFVAIAILFAIFKINPPPFCLLDEIESALDEVNVSRFANYAKNFCDNTQFIAISHRRGTMEAANALYGVTMQERGVSRLLSINVNEVEQKIGIKFNT